ncbi:D-2-hydroxyacid dehydrogenase [Paenibacillus thalictri]|uniref:D-2-hydroxyacid dehydrogenase n=1 Tax=Paenibacillus thalictri TaxID=2527873 RepID=A0A4Q9DGV5_9BACL|nr:D-2-hydroxyacid dehydrogenase [Paenibacillus thalictri]TBL71577.1 D-2-hydroxyacid dehydrogenase [Paenibacillus thalictri]
MSHKIVSVQPIKPEHEQQIRSIAPDWEFVNGQTKEDWLPHLQEAEIVIGWKSEVGQLLNPGTGLRWVQNWGAGVDKFPLAAFGTAGVKLTSTSGIHPYPISEHVIAMMLSFTRKIHLSLLNQQRRKWQNVGPLGEMHGKTVGIIGVGAIGTEIARLSKAFGMKVLGVKRTVAPVEHVDHMFTLAQLDEVLQESDYVVVTLPLTKDTTHIFGRGQFQAMKRDAFFINIGRGGTTDTKALIDALREGEIAGAGLDVFEVEPLPEDHPLWEMENVMITPHNSGSSGHYDERAMQIFTENLRYYIEGKPLRNLIDLQNEY